MVKGINTNTNTYIQHLMIFFKFNSIRVMHRSIKRWNENFSPHLPRSNLATSFAHCTKNHTNVCFCLFLGCIFFPFSVFWFWKTKPAVTRISRSFIPRYSLLSLRLSRAPAHVCVVVRILGNF